ncbi:hypothetical protein MKZ26_02545 [Sporosarcina sp. FSL K6-6792]|uniref:hypothetical protein n=1 Tax=Sporosarcina sp. FSL K6-6792 TaxID=2921559 RepID=UPI0030FB5B13
MELDLAKRTIAGDERALVKLLAQHEDTLYRTAYAYLKNEHDAIEAMQELTYRALKKDTYRQRTNVHSNLACPNYHQYLPRYEKETREISLQS